MPADLRLSTLPQKTARARARAWTARLVSHESRSRSAGTLYAGDHWQVALSLAAETRAPLELWVASAGYGLIPVDREIKPYGATFSDGPDSVAQAAPGSRAESALQEWWTLLAESDQLAEKEPRSLRELVATAPEAILVVALSKSYLTALRGDLIAARTELRGPGRILVISAGTKSCPGLEEDLLDVGAEAQASLGGSRLSLNVRIARHLIRTRHEHGWRAGAINSVLKGISGPRPTAPRRSTLSDGDILDFIRQAHAENVKASRAAMLRRLRDQGFACEQGRFQALFASALLR